MVPSWCGIGIQLALLDPVDDRDLAHIAVSGSLSCRQGFRIGHLSLHRTPGWVVNELEAFGEV